MYSVYHVYLLVDVVVSRFQSVRQPHGPVPVLYTVLTLKNILCTYHFITFQPITHLCNCMRAQKRFLLPYTLTHNQ